MQGWDFTAAFNACGTSPLTNGVSSGRCLLDPKGALPARPHAVLREKIGIRAWGKITSCELRVRGSWSTSIRAVGAGASELAADPPPTKPADGNLLLARTTRSVGSGLRLRRRLQSASAASSHWSSSPKRWTTPPCCWLNAEDRSAEAVRIRSDLRVDCGSSSSDAIGPRRRRRGPGRVR
jgi:hypothetical protein